MNTTAASNPPRMRHFAKKALLAHLQRVPAGTRLPPLADLARELGLGRCNLQEAMRDLANDGVVVSRPRLGTYVAETGTPGSPDPSAPTSPMFSAHSGVALKRLRGKRIAMAAGLHPDGLMLQMMRAAAGVLQGEGAQLFDAPFVTETFHFRPADVSRADLAIFFNPPSLPSWGELPKVPLVMASTGWYAGVGAALPGDLITVDQERSACLAGEFLRTQGFTEACFIGTRLKKDPTQWNTLSLQRLHGFEAGFGKPVAPEFQLNSEGYSLEAGGRGLNRFQELPRRPLAIFAASDDIAAGFLVVAVTRGLQPGRDFHLVGFDGQHIGRRATSWPLTTVEVPAEAMGVAAAEAAINRILYPDRPMQTVTLSCQVFRGATVGTPPASASPV